MNQGDARGSALGGVVAVLAALAFATPASAVTQNTGPCTPSGDVPTSKADTQWSVRTCTLPDYDQRRVAGAGVGQPNAVSVDGLPGNGGCHCVLASIADLYGRARAPLDGAGEFATFDWGARGALPGPASPYDTSSYTAAEVDAYNGTTAILDAFGDTADVQFSGGKCGTGWANLYNNLGELVDDFGEAVGDYGFTESGLNADSAYDMARALAASGTGVAFAYGYYGGLAAGANGQPDTATARNGGHANALFGISRNGNTYTIEAADPAASAETSGEDTFRQSQFTRTTWTATVRSLKVAGVTSTLLKLEDTNRYIDSWISFKAPKTVLQTGLGKILVQRYVPARDLPRPPVTTFADVVSFPGQVLDAAFDQVGERVLALVRTRTGTSLFAADAFTGDVSKLAASLPAGSDRVASLPEGRVGVLGASALRVLGREGATEVTRQVAGTDLAADPRNGGVAVLRRDGAGIIRLGRTLAPQGTRSVPRRFRADRSPSVRLTLDAAGRPTVGEADRQIATTPGGATVELDEGRLRLLDDDDDPVAGRSVRVPRGASLLDVAFGTSARRVPPGALATDPIDKRLEPAPPGYEEFAR